MTKYTGLRISSHTQDYITVYQYFKEYMKRHGDLQYFSVFEHKGIDLQGQFVNPHLHIMVHSFEWTNSVRMGLTREMIKLDPSYKNEQRGLKRLCGKNYTNTTEGYYYLCKGQDKDTLPIVVDNSVLTYEQIETHHKNYWEVRSEFEVIDEDDDIPKATGKVLKVKPEKVAKKNPDEIFIDWFNETQLCFFSVDKHHPHIDYEISQYCVKASEDQEDPSIPKYYFGFSDLLDCVLMYHRKVIKKGFRKHIVEHKLNTLYNCVVHLHDLPTYTKYKLNFEQSLLQSYEYFNGLPI